MCYNAILPRGGGGGFRRRIAKEMTDLLLIQVCLTFQNVVPIYLNYTLFVHSSSRGC